MMDWNTKAPSQWDWENLVMFNTKSLEIPKKLQPTDWGFEGEGAVDSESLYSSGGFSGSDLGYGSPSKSSKSSSLDFSSKEGTKTSRFSCETPEGFTIHFNAQNELDGAEPTKVSRTLEASVISAEPLIGLKLGKRTYFEDVCVGSNTKTSAIPVNPASPATNIKRSRSSCQISHAPRCQVEGCNLDLSSAKDYHRKHRVCESHSKCPKVIVDGLERRFCQQCSRFHNLSEFDEKKRSCRRRLSDHNARRRKPPPEAIQFNSMRLSSSFYGGRQHMSFAPVICGRASTSSTWDSTCGSKLGRTKACFINFSRDEGLDRQVQLASNKLVNAIITNHDANNRLLPSKRTTAEVLNQGFKESMISPSLNATQDFRRALSLLSTNTWSSCEPEPDSLNHIIHVNSTSIPSATSNTVPPPLPLAPPDCWRSEQQTVNSRVHTQASYADSSGHFQEFQLFRVPYDPDFYANQYN